MASSYTVALSSAPLDVLFGRQFILGPLTSDASGNAPGSVVLSGVTDGVIAVEVLGTITTSSAGHVTNAGALRSQGVLSVKAGALAMPSPISGSHNPSSGASLAAASAEALDSGFDTSTLTMSVASTTLTITCNVSSSVGGAVAGATVWLGVCLRGVCT